MNDEKENALATQTARVLMYLQSGNSISPLDALELFGSLRLGSIIHRLRRRGVKIVTTMTERENGAPYAVYSLKKE